MSYNSIIKNCNFYTNNRISSLDQLKSNEIYAELFFYESIRTNFQLSLKLYIISQNSSDIDVFEKNSNFVIIDKEIEINEEKQVFSFNLNSLNTDNIDISNVNLKACFVVLEKDTKLLYKDSYVKDIVINDLARYEPPVYEEYYTSVTLGYIDNLIGGISIINNTLITENKIFGVDDNVAVPNGLFINDFCLLISPFRDLNNYDSAYNNSKNLKISFSDLYDVESGNLYLDFENEGFLSNNLLYNYLKDTLFTDRRLSRDVTLYFYFIDKSSYIIKNKLEWNKTITIASIQKLLSKVSFIKNSNFIDSTLRISSLENDLYEINFDFLSDSAELDETILIRIKSVKSIDLFSDLELKDPVYKINNNDDDIRNIQIDLKSSSRKRLIFSSKDFRRRSNNLLLQITTSSLNSSIVERSVEKAFVIINSSYSSNVINSISSTLQQDSFVYNNKIINESINNAIKINTSATYDFVDDIFTNSALYIEKSDEMFPKLNKALYGFSTDVEVLNQVFFAIDLKVKINSIPAATLKNYFVFSEDFAVGSKINILSGYDDIELKEKSIINFDQINPRAGENNTIKLELKAKAILFKKDIITKINNESYDQSQISFLNRFLTTMIPDNSSPGSLIKIMNLKNIKKSDVYKNIDAYFDEYYIERSFQI
jgi:hypothetical protein